MAQIIKVPDQILRTPTKTIEKLDKKFLEIINQMRITLLAQKDPEGVGIAAPQIGIPLRIFFIRPIPEKGPAKEPKLFINPEITHYSKDLITPKSRGNMLEGCLSLPNYYGYVVRSKSVTVKYFSLETNTPNSKPNSNWELDPEQLTMSQQSETFSGFPAQIVQHEFDHLNGTLFIDRILEQNGKLYEVHGDNWKEVSI